MTNTEAPSIDLPSGGRAVGAEDASKPGDVVGSVRAERGAVGFTKEPSESALERIADAMWNGRQGEGIVFLDVHQHNACNHTLSGTIDVAGVVHGFIIESGDWNGTVVLGWGDPEDVGTYQEPAPGEPLTFVPCDEFMAFDRPAMFGVYLLWRKEPWFKEQVSGYLYDRHFAPGGKTESHYREWASKKGLKVGLFSAIPRPSPTATTALQEGTQGASNAAPSVASRISGSPTPTNNEDVK